MVIFISSCVYYPQLVDIPLVSEEKELKIDAGISYVPSINASASYGLTDKIAVQAFGRIYGVYYIKGAVGYYKNFSKNNIFELYIGSGYGYGNAYKFKNES